MATRITIIPDSPEEWLAKAKDQILECRGQGHDFPKMRSGKRRRHNVTSAIVPDSGGVICITFTCPNCGTERFLFSAPGGELVFPSQYKYDYPPGYKAPKGVTRRMAMQETWRRIQEDVD